MEKIGITEHGDPCFDLNWLPWVKSKKPAILITKDPLTLYKMIKDLIDINVIIHATITGNGGTIIEPNVPNYKQSLEGLYKLIKLLGKERVVLRIDPIIPHKDYIKNSKTVLDEAKEYLKDNMCRVRISIYDNYKHSKERMMNVGVVFNHEGFNLPIEKRKKIINIFGDVEICGEQGIKSTPCLSEIDCKIFGVEPTKNKTYQRYSCECLSNKFELLKKTGSQCEHQCKYCFWKKDFKEKNDLFE